MLGCVWKSCVLALGIRLRLGKWLEVSLGFDFGLNLDVSVSAQSGYTAHFGEKKNAIEMINEAIINVLLFLHDWAV